MTKENDMLAKENSVLDCAAGCIYSGNGTRLAEKEQELVDNYRMLPDDFKDLLLAYSDFCLLKVEWDKKTNRGTRNRHAEPIIGDNNSDVSEIEHVLLHILGNK